MKLACLLSVLLLAGCAAAEWTKPSAEESELSDDSFACQVEAEERYPVNHAFNVGAQRDWYARCMRERGWTRMN
jgi:hypothetical protein